MGAETYSATDAALILGLEAVFAGFAAWLILNQDLLPLQILGCSIIFAAVMFSQLKNLVPEKKEASSRDFPQLISITNKKLLLAYKWHEIIKSKLISFLRYH